MNETTGNNTHEEIEEIFWQQISKLTKKTSEVR